MIFSHKTLAILLLALALPLYAAAAPMDIPQGAQCKQCGMKVDPASVYSAEVVHDGEMLPFCDIGDMLYYFNKQDEKPSELYVRDNESGRWMDAAGAVYVTSKKFDTPMSWGIAAFADREEASKHGAPMTFDEALASIR